MAPEQRRGRPTGANRSVRDAGRGAVKRGSTPGSSRSNRPSRIPPPPDRGDAEAREEREPMQLIDEGPAERRPGRSGSKPSHRDDGPSTRTKKVRRDSIAIDGSELERAVGKKRAARLRARVEDATAAYLEERYIDAGDILRPIAKEAPDVPMVREILGLTHYRRGQWKSAIRELEAFVDLTGGSVEQHPVLADAYRAMGRHKEVDRLFAELGAVSPSAELMTEGRIVRAGSLADRGELAEAIEVLEKNRKTPKRAKEYHLRRAYALADLYERAGEVPRARSIFEWVFLQDRDFADAAERL